MTPEICKWVAKTPDPETWHWFVFDMSPEVGVFDERPHLPFDRIAVFTSSDGAVGPLFIEEDTEGFLVHALHRKHLLRMASETVESFEYTILDANLSIDQVAALGEIVIGILWIFAYKTTQEYVCISNPANKKRVAKGKKPLYEWRTVTIEPTRPAKNEPQGGTHASPRAHTRRGHWVTRNGKRFWRRDHHVGNAANGTVFHDYVVKGG